MSDLGLGIQGHLPNVGSGTRTPSALKGSDGDKEDVDVQEKLRRIELLPDIFALIQSLELGELQPKDFDNTAGTIRLKLNTVRQYLQEVEGICESTEERKKKIENLEACNEKKRVFLKLFRDKVLQDLEE